jgi:3-phosphoinositide dependent protein kinase-1
VGASALSTQEWLDTLDRAKEIALLHPADNLYMGDEGFRDMSSGVSSHANTLDHTDDFSMNLNGPSGGRSMLMKQQPAGDSESVKGKKRFSRRHSKNGLSAVF